jgi:hypothetical protein
MMMTPEPSRLHTTRHPLVYEVNTRILLRELSAAQGKPVTLTTIPDAVLDEWAGLGFDAIWMMGVWNSGKAGEDIARNHPGLADELRKVLPDLAAGDVSASPYSVKEYKVPRAMGGLTGLRKLRSRLASRGLGLILDFVPNHTALDHLWVTAHPEYYVGGEEADLKAEPGNYFAVKSGKKSRVLAHGRDPLFPGWTDTVQMNHRHLGLRAALIETLKGIAAECDGVRCDMAMLVLRSVFEKTWGERAKPAEGEEAAGEFWKEAIETVKAEFPDFVFIAEAYWNLEWELQQLGFNFTYDKTLYDRLLKEGAWATREHLRAEPAFQARSLRFIENHDEQRAARSFSSEGWHLAAALVTATIPGMLLLHEGQLEGRRTKIPVQLLRRPPEPRVEGIFGFYSRLLQIIKEPVFRRGTWTLLNVRPAWHDNSTWQNFMAFWWHLDGVSSRLIIVNYAPHSGQAYVEIPGSELECQACDFRDLMSKAQYVRDRQGLVTKGMYFDLVGYGFHVFEACPIKR